MRGRGGMGQWQPDMQRHEAGLRSGAEQNQQQHQRLLAGRQRFGPHRHEGVAAIGARQ